MHRSSASIGSLAAALAKAQAELINPQKSLSAMIHSPEPGGGERSFRYAPLSSGLEIVRRCLGKHEIATVQTTAIDQASGLIQLTTVLAHASGEWVSSDWPVCPASDTAVPHRMGAALTYARRYGLFTLVGIAGDDDLDAPDLVTLPQDTAPRTGMGPGGDVAANGAAAGRAPEPLPRSHRGPAMPPSKPVLAPAESARLRTQLEGEIAGLLNEEEVLRWAHRSLSAKNTLTAEDARAVEEAFEAQLKPHEPPAQIPLPNGDMPEAGAIETPERVADLNGGSAVLLNGKPRRRRDKDHLAFVAAQPCVVCGRQPADAHHLRSAQPRALGRKVSDEFTVPLCRLHHRQLHDCGDEAAWWEAVSIDPMPIAQRLWSTTRNPELRDHRL